MCGGATLRLGVGALQLGGDHLLQLFCTLLFLIHLSPVGRKTNSDFILKLAPQRSGVSHLESSQNVGCVNGGNGAREYVPIGHVTTGRDAFA